MEDDDDIVQLSSEALAALEEFYSEQKEILAKQQSLVTGTSAGDEQVFQNDLQEVFPEDWNMSQFWYDETTSKKLADEVKSLALAVVKDKDYGAGKIVCISSPSVFRACGPNDNIDLFEYDKRFSSFGPSFHFYDYKEPDKVPEECLGKYDVIIADPPFLSNECLEKLWTTIKLVSKSQDTKIILCTGAIMEKEVLRLMPLKRTNFLPLHKKNLGNEFACFANYDLHIEN